MPKPLHLPITIFLLLIRSWVLKVPGLLQIANVIHQVESPFSLMEVILNKNMFKPRILVLCLQAQRRCSLNLAWLWELFLQAHKRFNLNLAWSWNM
ncbi:hypothetical protein GLYMA_10G121518v4 [Glycine max]|uniref:Secreted protein n=1 Tax=Glycine soja TaxID=3848 RepID=A0A445ILB8_GLYSO|nr:hypothetical protein GLYMA_10G121518v4 [Glycine max]KAH1095880.1 hypothetical protein GYH30_057320 [Glycine max]RZB86867.1 hypothetical protein D0Y65_026814 [Glycine soja]